MNLSTNRRYEVLPSESPAIWGQTVANGLDIQGSSRSPLRGCTQPLSSEESFGGPRPLAAQNAEALAWMLRPYRADAMGGLPGVTAGE